MRWFVTKTGEGVCINLNKQYVCRYFLIQFRFKNDKDAHEALGGLDVKSLREVLKVAMKTLHGDYGLGCVQHSLNSKLLCL